MSKRTIKPIAKTPTTLFEKFEHWANRNNNKIFYGLLSLTILLSLISFNARISEANDDALYLEAAWRYVNEFPDYFYAQNAPLYPLFLGLLVKIFGFKIILFKLFSVLFNAVGFVLFYKALKGRVPAIVFIPVAIFQAANHLIIYFASMTFTEAFYFFLLGLFCFITRKILDEINREGVKLKQQLSLWLMLGLSMFLMSIAKSNAIVVVPAVCLFFMYDKNWRAAAISLGSYLTFRCSYEVLLRLTWNNVPSQFTNQSKILLRKDTYNGSLGNDDFGGFVQRFIDNCNLGLSKRFYQLLGFRDENNTLVFGFLTLFTIALIVIGFLVLVKQRNKLLIVIALFTLFQLALSYIALQAKWDQPRITLICMPVLLLLMLGALYSFISKSAGIGQLIYFTLVFLIVSSVCISSFKRGYKNIPILQKNLQGNMYFGYTTDWQNFLKASEWCADSLNKESFVASRKAPMSFVYGKGKKFFPIYSIICKDPVTQQSNPDSALVYLQKNKVTHVILANLRVDPTNPSGGIVNTLQNIFIPIAEKYPAKLQLIHTEGAVEKAEVYEIKY